MPSSNSDHWTTMLRINNEHRAWMAHWNFKVCADTDDRARQYLNGAMHHRSHQAEY